MSSNKKIFKYFLLLKFLSHLTAFLFQCIHATAEALAKNFNYTYNKSMYPFEYCSAKYSKFFYEDEAEDPGSQDEEDLPRYVINNTHYMNVSLEKDSHFYNINVNTNTSCVHVPTNIFDEGNYF